MWLCYMCKLVEDRDFDAMMFFLFPFVLLHFIFFLVVHMQAKSKDDFKFMMGS